MVIGRAPKVPQVDAHSTERLLVVGLAAGYDFAKVRVFAESLQASSGGPGKQTELVLAGLKENNAELKRRGGGAVKVTRGGCAATCTRSTTTTLPGALES